MRPIKSNKTCFSYDAAGPSSCNSHRSAFLSDTHAHSTNSDNMTIYSQLTHPPGHLVHPFKDDAGISNVIAMPGHHQQTVQHFLHSWSMPASCHLHLFTRNRLVSIRTQASLTEIQRVSYSGTPFIRCTVDHTTLWCGDDQSEMFLLSTDSMNTRLLVNVMKFYFIIFLYNY